MSLEIGGQAVIEGVMLRSKDSYAIAVRTKQGNIKTKRFPFISITKKNKLLGLPLIRGIISTGEMLYLGMKSLIWSTEQAEEEKLTKKELTITIAISVILVIGFFIALPLILTKTIVNGNSFIFSLIDGLFRLGIFLGYVWGIGFLKDVKTLFKYHGAEHKVVNCYEDKKPLTFENLKKYKTIHPRCGTSFIFIVFILSIILFSFITHPSWIVKFLERIILIPVIASLGYELLKLSAKLKNNQIIKIIIYPGLLFQKLTTKQPSNKQLEVAVASFKALEI